MEHYICDMEEKFKTGKKSQRPYSLIKNKRFRCTQIHANFPAHSSKNPWDFLSVESWNGVFCYVDEVIFGKPLGNLRMGSGCQGNQPVLLWLKLSVSPPYLQREERGREFNGRWFNQSCLCNWASMKTPKKGIQRASMLVNQDTSVNWVPKSTETKALLFGTLPYVSLHLVIHW